MNYVSGETGTWSSDSTSSYNKVAISNTDYSTVSTGEWQDPDGQSCSWTTDGDSLKWLCDDGTSGGFTINSDELSGTWWNDGYESDVYTWT